MYTWDYFSSISAGAENLFFSGNEIIQLLKNSKKQTRYYSGKSIFLPTWVHLFMRKSKLVYGSNALGHGFGIFRLCWRRSKKIYVVLNYSWVVVHWELFSLVVLLLYTMALCVLLLFHVNFRQYGNIMITLVSPIWLHKTHPFSILCTYIILCG